MANCGCIFTVGYKKKAHFTLFSQTAHRSDELWQSQRSETAKGQVQNYYCACFAQLETTSSPQLTMNESRVGRGKNETNMLSCWHSGSHSVIISLSHLVLICDFDELVGGGLPWDSKHTHTHAHEPSPLISLIYYDMWLAANSILQICTLAGSRIHRCGAPRSFLSLYTLSDFPLSHSHRFIYFFCA